MAKGESATAHPDAGAALRQAVIDELGEVERQYRLWNPGVNPYGARLAELNAIVDSWYQEFDPELSDVVESPRYRLEVKPRQYHRELTAAAQARAFAKLKALKVHDRRGKEVRFDVLSLFQLTQAQIVKYLGQAFLDEIAPATRSGRRTYKLVPKAAPQLVKPKERAA